MRRNVLFFAIALMLSAGLGAGWAQSSDATLSEQVRDEIKEHKEAIDKYLAVGNKNEAAYHANKIAFNYWVNGLLDQSLVYFKQSLQYNQEIGNTNAIASIYNFLGQVYNDKEDYTNALKNFQEALTIRRKMKDKQNMASIMSSMATVYNTTKQYQNAVNILEDAIDIAKELQDKKKMANIYGMLANNYEEMGNSQKSFEYLNLYSAIDKVILKEETEKRQKMAQDRLTVVELKANEAEAEVDSAKRRLKSTEEALVQVERINQENMLQIELLQKEKQIKELTIKEQEAKLQFQVLLRNSFIGGFILVGLLAFVLYRGYMERSGTTRCWPT
ncbi:MAG: tetratricopeptide repeat protein [Cytophagales bacterium]|nr:tetratricopeptide repeat protein [Cytophagales bacterium]